MYVRAGRPAFAQPYVGVHRSTSLMSSSLLLQQCPACLVRLTCIVFVMGGRWPYSWCLVGCCCQEIKVFSLLIFNDFLQNMILTVIYPWTWKNKWPISFSSVVIILLQGTARPHVTRTTLQRLTDLAYEILSHPLYSPDLSPTINHFLKHQDNFMSNYIPFQRSRNCI